MKGEKPIFVPRTSYTPFLVIKWYFQPDRGILERYSMHYHFLMQHILDMGQNST